MTDALRLHEKYMKRCIELAVKGLGRTKQNPLVGSVIVHENRIIGEGYHREFGGPHAEVLAIESVKDKSLLRESTLYVNLEPCSHQGKTPSCSLLLKDKGIPKVIIGCTDPNPLVSGKGIRILIESGVDVTTGILEEEAVFINRRFFKFINEKRPYVILKWAQSKDGFLDKIRKKEDGVGPNWITNETSRILVHKWRSEEAAIMAGVNTVLTDNPALNVRNWPGNNPLRVIIDRNNRIDASYSVMDGALKTLVFSSVEGVQQSNTEYVKVNSNIKLDTILDMLGAMGVNSLLVEGGALLIDNFIDLELWDEARVFTGKAFFREGLKAPVLQKPPKEVLSYRNNLINIYQRID